MPFEACWRATSLAAWTRWGIKQLVHNIGTSGTRARYTRITPTASPGLQRTRSLVIHQARHPHADVYWLYTAVSRATGPSNVRVIDDLHRSESDMSDRARTSWV
ncbi:unnamed protein product, partial [Laminaria digitata]